MQPHAGFDGETPCEAQSLHGNACPVARTLDLIGDWWSLLIIRDALEGIRRFSDFQKNLDIAKNMLSARLKSLVEQGILQPCRPPMAVLIRNTC
jgi:DNA-binding HxlR family transcriptional regulator